MRRPRAQKSKQKIQNAWGKIKDKGRQVSEDLKDRARQERDKHLKDEDKKKTA